MRILLTGGGTAGHVNPALAIAQIVTTREPDAQVAFVASAEPGDKAADLVTGAGYSLQTVHICGMHRPLWSPKNIRTACLMATSQWEARRIIREFHPDLIVGTGGYACWPVVRCGARMGIPTVVHESNAKPGKAILQVKDRVDRILVNFPETIERLQLKSGAPRAIRVGNPFLADYGTLSRREARDSLHLSDDQVMILSFGGSLGAEYLNDAVVRMMERMAMRRPRVVFYHATGKRDFQRTFESLAASSAAGRPNVHMMEYIYDMPRYMIAADVVISRAGAMSISELALTAKAAVLIPSPYVADQHQLMNAQALSRVGAGLCIEEATLTEGTLSEAVEQLIRDPIKRRIMGQTLHRQFATPDANDHIYRELKALVDVHASERT